MQVVLELALDLGVGMDGPAVGAAQEVLGEVPAVGGAHFVGVADHQMQGGRLGYQLGHRLNDAAQGQVYHVGPVGVVPLPGGADLVVQLAHQSTSSLSSVSWKNAGPACWVRSAPAAAGPSRVSTVL